MEGRKVGNVTLNGVRNICMLPALREVRRRLDVLMRSKEASKGPEEVLKS